MDQTIKKQVYTVKEAATMLEMSRWAVYDAINRGSIPHIRLGRIIRIPCTKLNAIISGKQCEGLHHERRVSDIKLYERKLNAMNPKQAAREVRKVAKDNRSLVLQIINFPFPEVK